MTSKALKFFGYGVPAFALIKVLSNLFFSRGNTVTPFKISVFIVLMNIFISLSLFKSVGFIIIPIATSISTWIGVITYFILLEKNKSLFINKILLKNILKIVFSAILMASVLLLGLDVFQEDLDYANKFKSIYLLFVVSFVATIYLISCYLLGVLKIKNYKIK
jgi:putative peptidoglycan lipid II flippase